MATVTSIEHCPRCKAEQNYTEYKYKSNESSEMCFNCGRFVSYFWQRDENGKLRTKDGTDNFAYTNLVEGKEEWLQPFGVYHIEGERGDSIGILNTKEDYEKFSERGAEIKADENIKAAFVNFFDDDEEEMSRIIIKGEPKFLQTDDDDEYYLPENTSCAVGDEQSSENVPF